MAEGQTNTPSQPSSTRESVRLSNPDVFSDDFALEPLELSQGPGLGQGDSETSHDAGSQIPRRSLSLQRALESPLGSLRRSRGSHRSDGLSSISSRSDNRTSHTSHPPQSITSVSDSGNTASTQHRPVRTISTFGFPRAQSPYQGATGPSHPYGMYSQNTGVTRTSSTATASTIRRPERTYSGPNEPTQPYAMYAQNTVPEDDPALVAGLAPPIAAGQLATNQNFQRRLGPDGEDADDLIGPDGYTEQLPPYSRYANGVPPKYTSGVGSVAQRIPPLVPIDGSQETLRAAQTGSSPTTNPFGDNSAQLSPTASDAVAPKEEDMNFKERVRQKGKKKVCCGISCWVCILLVAVVSIAILLGGIIGGVVAHKHGEQKGINEAIAAHTVTAAPEPTATTPTSPPPDAISLTSTPSNLPPLATGTFAIPLDKPTTVKSSCLTNEDQVCAWDCATGARLSMEISISGNRPMVSLSYPEPPDPTIRYGAQPPELTGQASLVLMSDKYDPDNGPAYIFAQQYNKTVIVHSSDLPGGLVNQKRSFFKRWFSRTSNKVDQVGHASIQERNSDSDQSDWTDNSIAVPADKPWYCYWPGTILEGFIYVTQEGEKVERESEENANDSAPTPTYNPTSQDMERRQAPSDLSPYPKLVKVEERRNHFNSIKPYCQQMQILNNGQPGPLTDPVTEQLVRFELDENEPFVQRQFGPQQTWGAFPTSPPSRRRALGRRDPSGIGAGSACQCEWMDD